MATIPTHAEWMKGTHSMTRPRSDFLKAVDEALKQYDATKSPQQRDAVKTALDRWRFEQSKQGKDWRKSVRNGKGTVTQLYRALLDVDKRRLSPEELEAMKYIARMQALALQKQFEGRELKFKSTTLVGMAQGAGTKWQKFKTGAGSVAQGAKTTGTVVKTAQKLNTGVNVLQQGGKAAAMSAAQGGMSANMATIKTRIRELCGQLCPDLDPDKVFKALNLPGVEQFATELAPFVGAISSGGKAIVGWIGVIKQEYQRDQIEKTRYAIAAGDPSAAFDAVIVLIDREIASSVAKASVKTGAFAGKTLGVFADAGAVTGPVIGLLEILADIFQTVIEYVRDYRECEAGNAMLRVGALNLELFEASPVLGCYFLVVQDHSTIINFAVGDYGTPNWMFDVEQLVAKAQKTLDKARQLIHASRLEVPGMSGAKGVVEENYSVKTGVSKVTALPGHVADRITDRLTGWFGNPEKPPAVDKSRIVGFGPKGGGVKV